MEEFEFTRYVVPLRDRMFRYAQSLLLCADEAEDVTGGEPDNAEFSGNGCGM